MPEGRRPIDPSLIQSASPEAAQPRVDAPEMTGQRADLQKEFQAILTADRPEKPWDRPFVHDQRRPESLRRNDADTGS